MLVGEGKQIKFKNGKKLGVIRKDKTFMTFRNEKKHFFRIYNGWALNKELLKELKEIGVEWIEIHTNDTNMIYRTMLNNFFDVGIIYKNRKNEKDIQIVLPIKYWSMYPNRKTNVKKAEKRIAKLEKWLK